MTEIKEIVLSTIECANRTVAYSVAGDPNGAPVLLFYPAGGNRRMLKELHGHGQVAGLKLICVNRPGKGETSPVEGGPSSHVACACEDAISVLNALSVNQVGLLFMCAGAPFALALAARYPERMTGKLVGLASWVLPADCDETKTKLLYKIGASLPQWLISPIVGNMFASTQSSITSLPQSLVTGGLKTELSILERDAFEAKYPDEVEFVKSMAYLQEETGGMSADVSVLLSTGVELGIDYRCVPGNIFLYHGEEDTTVPITSAEWLAEQIPSAVLTKVPQASHSGILFRLHEIVVDALHILSQDLHVCEAK